MTVWKVISAQSSVSHGINWGNPFYLSQHVWQWFIVNESLYIVTETCRIEDDSNSRGHWIQTRWDGNITEDLSALTRSIKCHTKVGHFFGCHLHFLPLYFHGKLSHSCTLPTDKPQNSAGLKPLCHGIKFNIPFTKLRSVIFRHRKWQLPGI